MRTPRGEWSYSPALHYREAARWAGVLGIWDRLPRDEQVAIVAQYEVITTLEALDAQAAADRLKAP